MRTPYLDKARLDAGKRHHPILYSWTVGADTWMVAVTPVIRERIRVELRRFFRLLAFLTFGVGISFLVGRVEVGLLILVILLIYGLSSWSFYLGSRSGILFPSHRTFFVTEHGFFNGYEYVARVRSYDIELRERRIVLQGSVFIMTNPRSGRGYWKEKEMLLMWDLEENGTEIVRNVKQMVLRKN